MLIEVNAMFKVFIFLVIVTATWADSESDDNYDSVIELFTNSGRGNAELTQNSHENNDTDLNAVLDDGLWKCGNCSELREEDVVHSEDLAVDIHDTTDYVQVDTSITLDVMRCVVVNTNLATAVIRVQGSCSGPTVTLSFLHATDEHTYTIKVYK